MTPDRRRHRGDQLLRSNQSTAGDGLVHGAVVLFRTRTDPEGYTTNPALGWGRIIKTLNVHLVDGDHATMLDPEYVYSVGTALARYLPARERPGR